MELPCLCEKCNRICDCGERLCSQCFVDTLNAPESKNLFTGGNFYKQEDDVSSRLTANAVTEREH